MPDKPSEAATEAVAAFFHLSRSASKQKPSPAADKIAEAIRARRRRSRADGQHPPTVTGLVKRRTEAVVSTDRICLPSPTNRAKGNEAFRLCGSATHHKQNRLGSVCALPSH